MDPVAGRRPAVQQSGACGSEKVSSWSQDASLTTSGQQKEGQQMGTGKPGCHWQITGWIESEFEAAERRLSMVRKRGRSLEDQTISSGDVDGGPSRCILYYMVWYYMYFRYGIYTWILLS